MGVNTDIEERNQFADQFNIDKIQKDDDENVFAKRYEDSTDEESEEMEKDKRRNKMDVNVKDSLNDFDEMDDSEINIVSDTKARGSNEFDSEDIKLINKASAESPSLSNISEDKVFNDESQSNPFGQPLDDDMDQKNDGNESKQNQQQQNNDNNDNNDDQQYNDDDDNGQ